MIYLAIAVNLISALLAAATIGIYLFAYTPLKRISTTNTLVGAIPGALPPLIGWAAARNDLALPAWTLFAILFFWQLPHFFAIGWMYREDYARAGFVMLSGRDLEGGRTGRQSIFFTMLLLVASVTPIWFEIASLSYLPIALSLGALFLALAFRFQIHRTLPTARQSVFWIDHLPAASARRPRPDETMSSASSLAPTRAPLSWSALAWKATLILIPLLTAGGLFFLRQVEVARLASRAAARKTASSRHFNSRSEWCSPLVHQQLLGKIWIADFVYSTCPGSLPDDQQPDERDAKTAAGHGCEAGFLQCRSAT